MKKVLFYIFFLLAYFYAIISFLGCSVHKATVQPEKKDLAVLKPGTHRNFVVAELGLPLLGEIDEAGNKYEVFVFVQGYSKAAKTGRALFHASADAVSLGLWEIIGTPIEGYASGTKMKIKVFYDSKNTVVKSEELK